jgi:hypothetical protein
VFSVESPEKRGWEMTKRKKGSAGSRLFLGLCFVPAALLGCASVPMAGTLSSEKTAQASVAETLPSRNTVSRGKTAVEAPPLLLIEANGEHEALFIQEHQFMLRAARSRILTEYAAFFNEFSDALYWWDAAANAMGFLDNGPDMEKWEHVADEKEVQNCMYSLSGADGLPPLPAELGITRDSKGLYHFPLFSGEMYRFVLNSVERLPDGYLLKIDLHYTDDPTAYRWDVGIKDASGGLGFYIGELNFTPLE